MRLSLVLSLMPLAGFVGALHVTEPEKGADIKASDSLTVKWTYVDTDAKSFNLYLVNNAVYPPLSEKIATDVKTSDGSYTIDSLGVSAGSGFQVNLQSDVTQNTGILAQSEQFNVTGSAQSSSTSSTTSTSTSSSASTSGTTTGTSTTKTLITVTGTSTSSTGTATGSKTTGTSGSTGAASSTGASASGTSSQTAVPSTGAAAALKVAPAAAAGLLAGALAFGL
ncbi:UPF0619 GPI-anchored membrane protein [Penicillium subrubescens]|uniref:UPF0619 GPI-anchored membrane protein n=1 Tax=Penicillium subrubescens TaxID=1316194 RepID=A0A1Q5TH97_9EURO|nr:UPF0619 GPI-anchored membrane protein [Penicillium subrubescens]KAJ5892047.1 UPF0619 GPI-anchored membrane protein [Penicillium subrubescens]OKO99581.1 UPF0619 GPI-anchored membrane protein [Penicillium subrubescens]